MSWSKTVAQSGDFDSDFMKEFSGTSKNGCGPGTGHTLIPRSNEAKARDFVVHLLSSDLLSAFFFVSYLLFYYRTLEIQCFSLVYCLGQYLSHFAHTVWFCLGPAPMTMFLH